MIDFVGLLCLMASLSVLTATGCILVAPFVAACTSGDWRWMLIYIAYSAILCPIAYIAARNAAPECNENGLYTEYEEESADADRESKRGDLE